MPVTSGRMQLRAVLFALATAPTACHCENASHVATDDLATDSPSSHHIELSARRLLGRHAARRGDGPSRV